MTNRILFRARAEENTISIQTYTPRVKKSLQQFYIIYSELDRLRSEGRIITKDIHSFAELRLDERHDRITFEFTWLSGYGFDQVDGSKQTVHLRWSKFSEFLHNCREPDGPKELRAVSLGERRSRPRLVFDGNRANLKAAISDPRIRHKLGKALFPDFFGAAAVNDLAKCVELSAVYRAKRQAEDAARRARAEEEEKAFCEERNREAQQTVAAAIQVIRDGGVLKNDTVRFYQSRYNSSSCSVVNYLMRLYHVDVPLRTQGWINEKLCSATVRDGKCEHLQFYRSKSGRCSQKFFECMNDLIRAVTAQASEETANR